MSIATRCSFPLVGGASVEETCDTTVLYYYHVTAESAQPVTRPWVGSGVENSRMSPDPFVKIYIVKWVGSGDETVTRPLRT